MIRGPVAEISLSAIANNLQSVKRIAKTAEIIGVVKADAYGHGAVEVSKKLLQEGVSCLAVAYTSEAVELRDAGISGPIIVLFDKGDEKDFFDHRLIPVVHNLDTALSLSREARKRDTSIKVHAKVDTGMGRLGFHGKHIIEELMKLSEMPGIELAGLTSHFSEADLSDRSYAILQIEKFNTIKETVTKKIQRKLFLHMANSAAVFTFKEAHLDAVRPGIMLYGYSPCSLNTGYLTTELKDTELPTLIPAMTIKTKILTIRDVPSGTPISYGRTFITKKPSRIGVLPLGYADGYSRLFSNNAEILVRGKRAPVVGKVCMDLTMVDLTEVKSAIENDEVVILGKQGTKTITADDLADKANTISYEILTSLGARSRKTYVET